MTLLITVGPWSSRVVTMRVTRVAAWDTLLKCSLTTADACSFAPCRSEAAERGVTEPRASQLTWRAPALTMRVMGVWVTSMQLCVAHARAVHCS